MRRFDWLQVLLIFLTIVVLLLVFTLVMAIVFPESGQRIVREIGTDIGLIPGSSFSGSMRGISNRASEGYQYRIEPFTERIFAFIARPYRAAIGWWQTRREKQKEGTAFEECISCHKTFQKRTALKNIYIDHKLHETKDISCSQCHRETKHPEPPSPSEGACIDCHKRVGGPTACKGCHPPGSIFSSAIIAKARTAKFLAKQTPKQILPSGLTQWNRQICKNCHDLKNFCNKCHLAFHFKLANWRNIHGPRILARTYNMRACWDCHKSQWCAESCHKNPGRQRISPGHTVPLITLEQFTE